MNAANMRAKGTAAPAAQISISQIRQSKVRGAFIARRGSTDDEGASAAAELVT
jgi:hypothetical protein